MVFFLFFFLYIFITVLDCLLLQDGFETFYAISQASGSELLDVSLEKSKAKDILEFFSQKRDSNRE
jgi:hypothetical protein